ncbi:MAG: hypothetical protein R6T89_08310 [Candidatus Syntrophosphaera sp.]
MSNATRNTIVLAVLFILLFALWYWQYNAVKVKRDEVLDANIKTMASIDSLKAELSVIDSLRQEYELLEALMHQQSKLVLGEDTTTVTYGYLLDLLSWTGMNINYDFAATDAQGSGAQYHEYVINGETPYRNLLHLANQIEKQRVVMTVEDLSIAGQSPAKEDTITFSMVLHTHYRPGGPALEEISMKTLEGPYLGYHLFRPRVYEEVVPPEVDPALLDIEDATLLGIARGMAFFRDSQSIIRILSKGSPVAWGYLYKVDEKAGKVIFRLDKYGLEEEYTILINNTE